jgi:PAS domain S-box-containing protein
MGSLKPGASLQLTLSAVISLLATSIVVAVSSLLIASVNRTGESGLRRKAALYAEFFSDELGSAVAFSDRQTAHEVLSAAPSLDRDIESVGLYREDGSLIEKYGENPPQPWSSASRGTQLRVSPASLLALARVESREGPKGVVVLRMSRSALRKALQRSILDAVALGVLALAVSLAASWFIASWVSRRLRTIVVAANSVARGDLTQPPLAPGCADEIGALAASFNIMVAQLRHLIDDREAKAAREQEQLALLVSERTSELAVRNDELRESGERFRLIAETTNAIPWEYSLAERRLTYVGPQAESLLGYAVSMWSDPSALVRLVPAQDWRKFRREAVAALRTSSSHEAELRILAADGKHRDLRCVAVWKPDARQRVRGLLLDVTQRKKLELELQQAQKLESVGRLASGIAHEINTPIQFVSDSIHFISGAIGDVLGLLGQYRRLREEAAAGTPGPETLATVEAAEEDADIDYLAENLPKSAERALEGLGRVATLVRSMKEFAHPDSKEKSPADLNRALQSTLTIARNEYKYVADVETSFGDIPQVNCRISELNQAFLNIIVNSAHAIGDVVQSGQRGTIRIATRVEDGQVIVVLADTGGGIPEAIRARIFDPFFTTKAVGKGTGQGLAIARSVVVEKHGGAIEVESEVGKGTTFTIRLPIDSDSGPRSKAA